MRYSLKILGCGYYNSLPNHPNENKTEPRKVDCFELEFFLSDSGISVLNNVKYSLKSGSLIFSKPGDIRYSYLHFKTYYVHFTVADPALKGVLLSLPCFLNSSKSDCVKKYFIKIIHSFNSTSVLENYSSYAQLISLLSLISKFEVDALSGSDVLGKAKKFIEQHYSENLTVKSIAKHCSISETHLYRIFKKSNSISPNDYLLDVRISAARKLLCITDLSINEIAFTCGFNSQCYFSDCFKRKNSISPSSFRKLYKYPF